MIGALVGELLDESRDQIAQRRGGPRPRRGRARQLRVPRGDLDRWRGPRGAAHGGADDPRDRHLRGSRAHAGEGEAGREQAGGRGAVLRARPPADPSGRRLDPALHLPEVVAAFEAARPVHPRLGKLVDQGLGAGLDRRQGHGRRRPADGADGGLHVVWLSGFERETVGRQVWVEAGQESTVDLGEAPAQPRLKVQRRASCSATRSIRRRARRRCGGWRSCSRCTTPSSSRPRTAS